MLATVSRDSKAIISLCWAHKFVHAHNWADNLSAVMFLGPWLPSIRKTITDDTDRLAMPAETKTPDISLWQELQEEIAFGVWPGYGHKL